MLLALVVSLLAVLPVSGQNAANGVAFHNGAPAISVQAGLPKTPQPLISFGPAPAFKTELDIRPEKFINTSTPNHGTLADGYLFVHPMYGVQGRGGPQIYDTSGNLIWQGVNLNSSMNLHVCDYLGQKQTHLCYHEQSSTIRVRSALRKIPPSLDLPETFTLASPLHDYGQNVILDQTYSPVGRSFTELIDDLPINGHVFQMLEGGKTFIGLSDQPTVMDLRPYGYVNGLGWVNNQCFSETDVETGENIFQWCYLESGLPIWETQTFFMSSLQRTNHTERKVGAGTYDSPWDFLHINSVDKNPAGDYYLSFRHGDQIIKVAGKDSSSPGSVVWKLGGRSNDFSLIGFPFHPPFSRQHDIRWISTSGSEEVISLFNNAFDGEGRPTQPFSDGQIIRINTADMTARLERSYPHPQGRLSGGRGNMQILPNKNVLIGWGTMNDITEYHENGTVLYHASFLGIDASQPDLSYRVYKAPWKGVPNGAPKLIAYSPGCNSNVVAYVSWNGATDVNRWAFYTGPTRVGPWIPGGTFLKDGFETQAELARSRWLGAYVKVKAIDAMGKTIGISVNQTYVPRLQIQPFCDEKFCNPAMHYFTPGNCEAWNCRVADKLIIAAFIILLLFYEAVVILGRISSTSIASWWMFPSGNKSSYVRVTDEEDGDLRV